MYIRSMSYKVVMQCLGLIATQSWSGQKGKEIIYFAYYIRKRTSFMGRVARLANNLDHRT